VGACVRMSGVQAERLSLLAALCFLSGVVNLLSYLIII
jgi:hypothetical protein